MSTQIHTTHGEHAMVHDMATGSTTATIGAGAAVILGILGLIGLIPDVLAGIAAIVIGVTLLSAGSLIATRYNRALASEPVSVRRPARSGMGIEVLAGIAGIVLGILALLGVSPLALLAVADIVLGAGLLMASSAMMRLESLVRSQAAESGRAIEHDAIYAASGTEVLMGVGAVVLGILALTGHNPVVLSLIAMIALGAAILLGDSPITDRLFGMAG